MLRKTSLVLALLVMTGTVMAQPMVFEKYWERLCNMPTAADDVRSLAVYPGKDLFVTIDRKAQADAIKVFNLQSGLPNIQVETMKMSGDVNSIAPGTYNIISGDFTSDGKLIACSLSYIAGTPLKVYLWDDVTTGPRLIYSSGAAWLGYRLGDALDVIGSTADNSAKVLISGNNDASIPLRLTTADNGRTWTAASIGATAVRAQDIEQLPGSDEFYASFSGGNIQHYSGTGAIIGTTPPDRFAAGAAHANASFALDIAGDRVFIMAYKTATVAGNELRVVKMSTGVELGRFTADPLNAGIGVIGVADGACACELVVSPGGGKYIYAASERNGVARYSFSTQLVVDKVGGAPGVFANIQTAIDSFCVGQTFDPAITTTVTLPLIIKVDQAAGPYDEALTLDSAKTTAPRGNIAGDLVLKGSDDTLLTHVKLQRGVGGTDDGIMVHQNSAGVIFKNLLLYPSTTGTVITDDMVKCDENSVNTDMNWIEWWNVVLTDIQVGGAPMVTNKAEALVGPHPARGSSMASGDQLHKHWNDTGESLNAVAENFVVYGGASYGCAFIMNGIAGEQVYVNNSLFAWNDYSGLEIGFRAGAKTKYARVTGTDAGAGPLNCTASIQNQWHGIYFYANVDGVCKVDNYLCYVNLLGDTANNDARAISGSGWVDLSIRDSVMMARNAVIVDGITNYPEFPAVWERCTLINNPDNANNTIFAVSNSSVLTVKDCVIGGPGTKFSGTTAANVQLSNCNIIKDGPWAIGELGAATEVANIHRYDPVFAEEVDHTAATLFDVRSPLAAGKSSTAGNLVGGADYIGDATPAVCVVDPVGHDFGSLNVGDPATTFTFVVGNTGGQPLYIYGNTINGSADFTVLKGLAASLAVGSTDTLAILYTPNSKGLQTANVEIAASTVVSPTLVPVQGTGLAPTINVPVASHNFGNQVLGSPALFQSFYVENTGTLDLVIGIPGIVGSADFAVDSAPTTIAAGTSDTLVVKYTPTLSGAQTATISIPSNDPATPSVDIVVSGFGSLSDVAVIGAAPALGAWAPASAANMNDLGILGDAVASDSIYTLEADLGTTTSAWKVLKDKNLGWGGGNDIGRQADGGDMPDAGTTGTITYFYDTRDLTADGWMPATEGLGSTALSNIPWVAVGSFQEAAGGANWDADSAVTAMRDDGLNGDAVAGDGVFTFQFQPATALTDAQWLVVSNLGSGWGGEYKFGSNGMAQDPGGVTQPQFSADRATEITMEYDAWLGHIRLTIVTKPPLAVHDWAMY